MTEYANVRADSAPPMPTGLLLSDCMGLVAGCAIWSGLATRLWPEITRHTGQAIVVFGFVACVAAFGAGPAVLLPRVIRWGHRTMTSSEFGWLVAGAFVDLLLVAAMLSERAATFATVLVPWLVTFFWTGFNMNAAFGSCSRWTHKVSIALGLASWTTLLVSLFAVCSE